MTLFYRDTTLSGDVRKKGIEQFLKTIGGRSGVRFLFTGSPSTEPSGSETLSPTTRRLKSTCSVTAFTR